MKNPELQLVVYGNNIAKYDVSISDNIKIINVRIIFQNGVVK